MQIDQRNYGVAKAKGAMSAQDEKTWSVLAHLSMFLASRRSFLRAVHVESTLTFAESLGGTSPTFSPEAASF
jgi:hypothetical protein